MAMDMFMKLTGIKGESRDAKHKEEIDVLAWSWGVSNSGTAHMGGGAGAGKANFQDISFTKYIDLSSMKLMLHCANGGHIDEAVLTVRKAGTTPLEYLVITMNECMITSVSTGGSGGEDRLTENVTINFAKVAVAYKAQDAKGAPAGDDTFKWDIAGNASE
jgi:type VI secretion system secreted protein Hcp